MTTPNDAIPLRLQEIIEDFRNSNREEKLELLLDFSERMPPLSAWLNENRNQMDRVHECMTPVYVYAENNAGRLNFQFDVPPESPTVRGYAALLAEGLAGSTPEEVLRVPINFYQDMGLQQVLSPQRLNGIDAILAHIKRLAIKELGQSGK